MNNLAKTIILNNRANKNFKAILSLRDSSEISNIRFYNLNSANRKISVAFKDGASILKFPLTLINNNGEFKFNNKLNFNDKLPCAVIDTTNPFCPEILLSSSENSEYENTLLENSFIQTKPENREVLYKQDTQQEIDNLVDKNLKEDSKTTYFDSCATCKYREYFYKNSKVFSDKEENKNICNLDCQNKQELVKNEEKELKNIDKGHNSNEDINNITKLNILTSDDNSSNFKRIDNIIKKDIDLDNEDSNSTTEIPSFFLQVKSQFDALFNKYDSEISLENKIPFSKWVKVLYDEKDNFYVVGIIYNKNSKDDELDWQKESNIKYLCYGIPSKDSINPPKEIIEFARWVEIESVENKGYWIVSQDAKTGQTMNLNLF